MNNLIHDMKNCFQFPGHSIYDHGMACANRFHDLLRIMNGQYGQVYWKLPSWIDQSDPNNLSLPLDEILHYCLWHDCGKPYCLEIKDGKQHFPNHAEISYLTYIKHFGNRPAAELIRRDMDIHLLKSDECGKFAEYEHTDILLLAGLCEIHANAEHSTGFGSTNFKIKWKHINQRGKAICRAVKEKEASCSPKK